MTETSKYVCGKDSYYDENVSHCQPCRDICGPPEIQIGICRTQCKDFLMRLEGEEEGPKNGTSSKVIFVYILVAILIFTLLVLILTILACRRKRKTTKSTATRSSRTLSLPLAIAHNAPLMVDLDPSPHITLPLSTHLRRDENWPQNYLSQSSHSSLASLNLQLVEDLPFATERTSELGGSLRSSVCDPRILDETKTFFQEVSELLSGLPYVKAICTSPQDDSILVYLARDGRHDYESKAREALATLRSEHEVSLGRIKFITL